MFDSVAKEVHVDITVYKLLLVFSFNRTVPIVVI